MENKSQKGQVRIECPNTIFQLSVTTEEEISKIEVFLSNVRTMKNISLVDIYNWCNRQGMDYDTKFNYHKELSTGKNLSQFLNYYFNKIKNQKSQTCCKTA